MHARLVKSDYVPVDGGRLHCRHLGTEHDGPPVLLIHGNRDNHTHFDELAGLLSNRRHVVAIDIRGHGLSSTLDRPMSLDLLAGDLRSVITHYRWPGVVLAGHSLGSVAAMTVAHRWPEFVRQLVLLGAAATFELKFKRPDTLLTDENFPQFVAEANRRAAPLFFREEFPDVAERVTTAWSQISLEVHRNLVAFHHPDLREVVSELRTPTLIVAGEHDRCTTVEQGSWIHQNLPGSEFVVIPGSGHFMYMERPLAVSAAIERFLDAH